MTIELDSTLAQAEVLFLSFTQMVADIDRRKAERDAASAPRADGLRRRLVTGSSAGHNGLDDTLRDVDLPEISDYLMDLLKAGDTK
jgi:hypothetical protein